jgi:hypothetical protein
VTIVEVFAALGRKWWVLVLALALGGVGAVQVRTAPEVYWATTKLVLAAPAKPENQRLAPGPSSLLALAGLLEAAVKDGESIPRSASPDVTLVDQGINDYAQVRVPNYGGQWANNYTEPALIVEASAPTEAVVRQRIDTLIERVEAKLASIQVGVPPALTITIVPFPAPIIQQSGGRRSLAIVVIGVLVLVGGCSLAVGLDGLWPRRIRRQAASASGSGVPETRARASAYVRRGQA